MALGLVPCDWELTDILCHCDIGEHEPDVQAAAETWATFILWASTGRRFGLCEVTVRPCGRRMSWGWGAILQGSLWMPYIGSDGLWRNCGCHGYCSCSPACEAYLPGPVASVVEVMVDGDIVDSSSYEVHDGHWLVRVDGDCWPDCPDMASSGAFEVTYLRGEPVPTVLATSARVLACEFAKACEGSPCRLPGRLQFIARQGVTAQFVDVDRLLDRGLTGLAEVDQVIAAMNPAGIKRRPRVFSPDRPFPRTVTTAAGS